MLFLQQKYLGCDDIRGVHLAARNQHSSFKIPFFEFACSQYSQIQFPPLKKKTVLLNEVVPLQ